MSHVTFFSDFLKHDLIIENRVMLVFFHNNTGYVEMRNF